MVPLSAIAYPVLSFAANASSWIAKRRIFPLYGELNFIEEELERRSGAVTSDLLTRLQAWDERAHRLRVPMHFVPILYSLRQHIVTLRAAHQTVHEDTAKAAESVKMR